MKRSRTKNRKTWNCVKERKKSSKQQQHQQRTQEGGILRCYATRIQMKTVDVNVCVCVLLE